MQPHAASGPAAERNRLGPLGRLKRAALLAGMSATALNVWTGSPLAALWIGSRVQGTGQPTMAPVFVVAACLGVFSFAALRLLRVLAGTYDRLVGRTPAIREHVPWLRSLRGERPHEAGPEYSLSALDIVLCVMVVIVLAVFEYWFFFLSTSSIDQRSGRG
ncbi:MAG: hypothetical protein QOF37_2756 [Thermoleophilaceae bacterium]|jgi:hypothetical protein|nr:hypothetical protein [Thermoleophilaceae bacterium]